MRFHKYFEMYRRDSKETETHSKEGFFGGEIIKKRGIVFVGGVKERRKLQKNDLAQTK